MVGWGGWMLSWELRGWEILIWVVIEDENGIDDDEVDEGVKGWKWCI